MSKTARRTRKNALGYAALLALYWAGTARAAPPDFSPTPETGWIVAGAEFMPPASGPGPVRPDPLHPHISSVVSEATGKQASFYMGDPENPILQPWARDMLRRRNAGILAGTINGETRPVSCWPMGVPGFLLYPVVPTFFLQTPREVVMAEQLDSNVRHVYLNVPHSAHVKPSWYGESVGRYDGDTLIVDTIGLNSQTYIDHYRTPHTAKLHVVERFHLTDGGKMLQVDVHVDDPGAFTTPWNAIQRYRRANGPLMEMYCAENNLNYNKFMNFGLEAIPQAVKADF